MRQQLVAHGALFDGQQSMIEDAKPQRTPLFHILPFLGISSEISSHLPVHCLSENSFSKRWFYTSGQISCHPQGSGDTKQTGVTQAVRAQLEEGREAGATHAAVATAGRSPYATPLARRAAALSDPARKICSNSAEPTPQTAIITPCCFSVNPARSPPGP